MPYINEKDRPKMNLVVQEMLIQGVKPDGKLNYILFKLCKHVVIPSYNGYKNYIGELEECIAEIRRRILAPYEDSKCLENGDVPGLYYDTSIPVQSNFKDASDAYDGLKSRLEIWIEKHESDLTPELYDSISTVLEEPK
jgi:hypothetical protein